MTPDRTDYDKGQPGSSAAALSTLPARRVPVVATAIVLLAVLTMVALGIWQIGRAHERDADHARHLARTNLPTVAYPFADPSAEAFRFRRLTAQCNKVLRWQQKASRSAAGQSGWGFVATCSTPGGEFEAELGFSPTPDAQARWAGGTVTGHAKLGPDARSFTDRLLWRRPRQELMIVAERPAPGLAPSMQPSPEDENNSSWGYAVQWFLFAATALVIYALALRKRWRERG
jgi:surfeit locus 1 family protein